MLVRTIVKTITTPEQTVITFISPAQYGRALFLHNRGANPITYKFQQANDNVDVSYTDIVAGAGTVNPSGTLASDSVVLVTLASAANFVRLRGNVSGDSELLIVAMEFSKYLSGNLPIFCA